MEWSKVLNKKFHYYEDSQLNCVSYLVPIHPKTSRMDFPSLTSKKSTLATVSSRRPVRLEKGLKAFVNEEFRSRKTFCLRL